MRRFFSTYSIAASVTAFFALSACASAEEAADLSAAQKQFMNSCGVCHTVESGAEIRQGPNLRSVVGRTAGTLAEFPSYSEALKKAGAGGLVWNEETLDKWITDAASFVPGAMMPYAQADPAKRKLIVAYLKSLSNTAETPPK